MLAREDLLLRTAHYVPPGPIEVVYQTGKQVAAEVVEAAKTITRKGSVVERKKRKRQGIVVERRESRDNDRMNGVLGTPLEEIRGMAEMLKEKEVETGDEEEREWEVYDFEEASDDENEEEKEEGAAEWLK
jgi:hypothetical protein